MTEQVEVVGVNPILQTENATVGEVITGSTVVALPLNGRNFAQLTLLAPGVQTHAPDILHRREDRLGLGTPLRQRAARAGQQLHARRRRPERSGRQPHRLLPEPRRRRRDAPRDEQLLGGVRQRGGRRRERRHEVRDQRVPRRPLRVRPERQLRRQQLGQQPLRSAKKGDFSQNIFGGTLGGPIVKNKVFFFADYQGTRVNRPGESASSVAPEAWRNGDFSSLLASGTVIRDPLTGQPFPGNIIPTSRFSPAATRPGRQHDELPAAQPAGDQRQLRQPHELRDAQPPG